MPAAQGFSINPVRGKIIEASFPIVETGALEGTVFRQDSDKPVAGITINLLDQNGEILGSTVTGYDGYYTFEFVAPGSYSLTADASHGVETIPNSATLTPDELFIYGQDITIIVPLTEAQKLAQKLARTYGPPMPEDILIEASEIYGPPAPQLQ